MTHAYHDPAKLRPGIDPEAVVLFDECDDCRHHAERPAAYLDDANLRALWREMIRVERPAQVRGLQTYRTLNEARACRVLHDVGLLLERLGWGPRAWELVP